MRSKKGIVTSTKQDKTVIVTVHTYKSHPKYKKKYRQSRKYHVHNPENKKFELGEEITFYETKPISKLKRWTLTSQEPKKAPKKEEKTEETSKSKEPVTTT